MSNRSNPIVSDADLIIGCIRGERRMQQQMYDKFASKMFGVCVRYAGNVVEAQDILQEGFIKVFRKIDSFRGEGSLEGWVRRIFINTAIEHYRKSVRMQPITDVEEEKVETAYLSVMDKLSEKDLVKLIQTLPDGYRTVFNLYVVEGFSHKEIADQLNITEGTSKSQLSRARLSLQNAFTSGNPYKQPTS